MRATLLLLATDGDPDLCGDDNLACARDALIAWVQEAQAFGIGTRVLAIGRKVDRAHLEDVANAGSGQPVSDQQRGMALQSCPAMATYSATGGKARVDEPDLSDPQGTRELLSTLVAGLRSCVFELRGGLQIDLASGDAA